MLERSFLIDARGEETRPVTDPVSAELSLLAALPESFVNGVAERIQDFAEHPLKLVALAGSSAAIGAGISLLGRSRELGPTAIKFIPGLLGSAAVVDGAFRLADPVLQTWANPDDLENQKTQLGKNTGGLLVDYLAMGLSGYAGARIAAGFAWGRFGSSSLGRDTRGLANTIRDGFVRPQELRGKVFSDGLTDALQSTKGNRPAGELSCAAKELSKCVDNLQVGVNKYLLQRKLAPRVILDWDAKTDSLGESFTGQAKVNLQVEHISNSSMADVVDTVAHELTHTEQDYLMLRRIADELGIGKRGSAEMVGKLKGRIEALEGDKPTRRFIDAALKMRRGQFLTPAEAARADKLIAEELQYHRNDKLDSIMRKRKEHLKDALSDIEKDPQALAVKLQSDKTFRKHFGVERADPQLKAAIDRLAGAKPADTAASAAGPAASPTEQQTSDVATLRTALDNALGDAKRSLSQTRSFYYNSLCEREARTIGARVAWQYVLNTRAMPWLVACGTAGAVDDLYSVGWLGTKVFTAIAEEIKNPSPAVKHLYLPSGPYGRPANTLTGQ